MDPLPNVDKWKNFLSSIDTNTSSTNNLTIKTEESIECLTRTFASKRRTKLFENQQGTPKAKVIKTLGEAHDESMGNNNEPGGKGARHELFDDRKGADVFDTSDVKGRSAEINDASFEEKPNNDETSRDTEPPADVKETGDVSNEKKRTSPKKTKTDIEIPSSGWQISHIAEYFDFDECVVKIKMPTRSYNCLDNIYDLVQKDICRLLKVVRGSNLKGKKWDSSFTLLKELIPITSIETGSRLVLDALLVPLCSVLGLQFEVERKIKHKDLPSCTYDYCIRKEERIIGCIEAKTVNTLSSTSIAQAILQLSTLQETLLQTETSVFNISELPLFAIVTDGHRFIYIQLTGSSLGFEHYQGKVRVRKVTEYADFKDILQHIIFLVDEAAPPEF